MKWISLELIEIRAIKFKVLNEFLPANRILRYSSDEYLLLTALPFFSPCLTVDRFKVCAKGGKTNKYFLDLFIYLPSGMVKIIKWSAWLAPCGCNILANFVFKKKENGAATCQCVDIINDLARWNSKKCKFRCWREKKSWVSDSGASMTCVAPATEIDAAQTQVVQFSRGRTLALQIAGRRQLRAAK
jgi:hypothetical protein